MYAAWYTNDKKVGKSISFVNCVPAMTSCVCMCITILLIYKTGVGTFLPLLRRVCQLFSKKEETEETERRLRSTRSSTGSDVDTSTPISGTLDSLLLLHPS